MNFPGWKRLPLTIRALTRMFHELLSPDHEDGRATGQPYRGIGAEAYLTGTSQGATFEDARQDAHIRGCSM